MRTAWAARTRGELARVMADLPVPPPAPPVARAGAVFARTGGGVAMQVLTIIWVALTVMNVTAWGIVTLTVGEPVYPWWLWVAGPPGARARRALRRRDRAAPAAVTAYGARCCTNQSRAWPEESPKPAR